MTIHNLIAHYLKSNNYDETLKQFEKEHGKQFKYDELAESLEDIISDRKIYKEVVAEPALIDDHPLATQLTNWKSPYPKNATKLDVNSLILDVEFATLDGKDVIVFTGVDKRIYFVDFHTKEVILTKDNLIGCVIKNVISIKDTNKLLLGGMDGKVYLVEGMKLDIVDSIQAHKRLISAMSYVEHEKEVYVTTIGWDSYVRLFKINSENKFELVDELKLTTNGTCVQSVIYQGIPVIVVGRVDSTLLEVLMLRGQKLVRLYKISLNDAEFSTHSFSPMSIAIFQKDGHHIPLIAIGTSHIPYMRLIVVSLQEFDSVLQQYDPTNVTDQADPLDISTPVRRNQIIKNLNTMSPQDKYSSAMVAWRFQGEGVWIMGDDGHIRGLDLVSQEVTADFGYNESKMKSFIAFSHTDMLLTCGVDRTVLAWTI